MILKYIFFHQIMSEDVWIKIRTDYVAICELVERVDHELRHLILLLSVSNLYFICFLLLKVYE